MKILLTAVMSMCFVLSANVYASPDILSKLSGEHVVGMADVEMADTRGEYSSSIQSVWSFCQQSSVDCGTIYYYKTRQGRDRWKVDFFRNGSRGTYSY